MRTENREEVRDREAAESDLWRRSSTEARSIAAPLDACRRCSAKREKSRDLAADELFFVFVGARRCSGIVLFPVRQTGTNWFKV
jgi:hypothetical protein